ncbi:Meiotic chromosome segregation protein [Seminavis robusta]|uniref:Meiotic chromosome segregation protein n=1 Tax=Seminavis robusta TaxID=568900 RepID=A0A9N8HB80_9STRA|nr:Meiotic chromosome segregation protein [Seminavis robusta]|eukprot:Sro173_g076400.1 Meiotic chromosome segregation protein (301) ;mRNA; r:67299-68391
MSSTPAAKIATAAEIAARRALTRATKPIPCYAVDQIPPKKGGEALYSELGTLVANNKAKLVQELEIPARDAKYWDVQQGQLFRIICSHGPQVADMNCWSLSNPKEHFYSSKTRQIHASHLTTGDRLWSNMPYLRPLCTIVHDTIAYGWDEDGAGVHDVIGSRCDPYTHHLMTEGEEFHHCCHSNLTRACIDSGSLAEEHVHDVLNVFMCTGFTHDTHQYFTKPSPVQVGDYIEFLAETDLRVAASTCPQGDVSLACGGGGEPVVYPLTVQVYEMNDKDMLKNAGWEPSQVSQYSRSHGLK